MDANEGGEIPSLSKSIAKPRKRFVGTSSSSSTSKNPIARRVANRLPDDILLDPELNQAIQGMPRP